MTEVLASRSFRGLATEDAINDVHNDMDSLWLDVPFVNDMDQMTFTTAVIESGSNIVQHAEPAGAGIRWNSAWTSPWSRCSRPRERLQRQAAPAPWNRQRPARMPSPAAGLP